MYRFIASFAKDFKTTCTMALMFRLEPSQFQSVYGPPERFQLVEVFRPFAVEAGIEDRSQPFVLSDMRIEVIDSKWEV
jgi:hypothetical protein